LRSLSLCSSDEFWASRSTWASLLEKRKLANAILGKREKCNLSKRSLVRCFHLSTVRCNYVFSLSFRFFHSINTRYFRNIKVLRMQAWRKRRQSLPLRASWTSWLAFLSASLSWFIWAQNWEITVRKQNLILKNRLCTYIWIHRWSICFFE